MSVRSYSDLDAWKEAMNLAEVSYRATAAMPESERFGLVQQIKRAAVSIPANIAEGHARQSDKALLHHLSIALGSLAELETEFRLAQRLEIVTTDDWHAISDLASTVGRLLSGLRRRVRLSVRANAARTRPKHRSPLGT